MATLKITASAESGVVVLPQEVIEELGLTVGEYVIAYRTADAITLVPGETNAESTMEIARDVAERRREMLRRLAD
jgi:bifunctional DNA-binding transcriptional regulator/antitoxin component of YhaV-PrlF toxin-antitoxin module